MIMVRLRNTFILKHIRETTFSQVIHGTAHWPRHHSCPTLTVSHYFDKIKHVHAKSKCFELCCFYSVCQFSSFPIRSYPLFLFKSKLLHVHPPMATLQCGALQFQLILQCHQTWFAGKFPLQFYYYESSIFPAINVGPKLSSAIFQLAVFHFRKGTSRKGTSLHI